MSRFAITVCAVALAVASAAAQAQTASQDAPQPAIEGYYPQSDPPSTMTRAEVMADVQAARAAGELGFDHDGDVPAYPMASTAPAQPVRFASDVAK